MNKPRLIIVDDEPSMVEFAADVAIKNGYEVKKFTNSRQFKQSYNNCADLLMIDLVMPEVDGIELIRYLASINSDAQIVLMSGFDSGVLQSAQMLALEHHLNIIGILNKPFRFKELNRLLQNLSVRTSSIDCVNCNSPVSVDELKHAIDNNELLLHYQPKSVLEKQGSLAVEALVRWQHPVHGLLGPDVFIPLAEENGLIDALTWVVLAEAVKQCESWRFQGVTAQVAINMSANTFKDLDLPDKLEKLLKQHGLVTSQLVLEITETTLMHELITSLDILTRLRMKGIGLSIDDFGTGYSSMVQLHRVPFSEIKIDRSFVSVMETDPEAKAIVETVIMLGHKLKMKTVAEGVETLNCKEQLIALGCDELQGYFISRPVPGEQVFDWFLNNQKRLKS